MFDSSGSSRSSSDARASVSISGVGGAEAARLYGELRAEAARDVIVSLGADNHVKILTASTWRDAERDKLAAGVRFTLNGKLHEVTADLGTRTLEDVGIRAFAEALGQKLGNEIYALLTPGYRT